MATMRSILVAMALCVLSHALVLPSTTSRPQAPPLVIWHGLGDNYNASGLLDVGDIFHSIVDAPVYFVRLDDNPSSDRTATFFGNVSDQVSQVCEALATHPVLSRAPAINALGFSQGGQFLRGYVERCNRPAVRNLVTFGSQHNGISKFQRCEATDWLCRSAQGLLRSNTWSSFVQSRLVPAQYFRDPEDLDAYRESSNFLADVNNERKLKNAAYRARLASLDRFVMYLFTEDEAVIPKESAWFAEVNSTTKEVTELRDRDIFREDWLGLKALDDKGGLKFEEVEGGHMQLSAELLVETFKTYFAEEDASGATYHDAAGYDLQEEL